MKRVLLICVLCVWGASVEGVRNYADYSVGHGSPEIFVSLIPFFIQDDEVYLVFGSNEYQRETRLGSGQYQIIGSALSGYFDNKMKSTDLSKIMQPFTHLDNFRTRGDRTYLYLKKIDSLRDLNKKPFATLSKPEKTVTMKLSDFLDSIRNCSLEEQFYQCGNYMFLSSFIYPFVQTAETGKPGDLARDEVIKVFLEKIAELSEGEIAPPVVPVTPKKKSLTVEQALEAFATSLTQLANKI